MSEEKKDVEQTTKKEEPTSSTPSTEEKQPEESKDSNKEADALKVLKEKTENRETPPVEQEKEESEDKTKDSKKETLEILDDDDKIIQGREKEKDRLLDDIKNLRADKKTLKDKTTDGDDYNYDTEDASSKQDLEFLLDKRDAKKDFFNSHPDIYSGVLGLKNQQLVEEYIKLQYDTSKMSSTSLGDLRDMVHQKYFSGKDAAIRKAKMEGNKEAIINDLAATGSDKGKSTLQVPKKTPTKIFPKEKTLEEII